MRSSVFLCYKGNILAIFKELLVENPLCCEDKFWPQRVMEQLDAHVIDVTNAISCHGFTSETKYSRSTFMGFKTARRFFKLSPVMCDVNIQRGLGVCVEVRVICHVNFFKKRVHVNYSWELKFYFLISCSRLDILTASLFNK